MRAASEARQFSGETWRVLTNLPKEQVGKKSQLLYHKPYGQLSTARKSLFVKQANLL